MRCKKSGFTLLELVVVLVIMGILAAAAIPTFMGYIDETKKTICESQRGQMRRELTALEFSETGGQGKLLDTELQTLADALTSYRCQQGGVYNVTRGTDGVVMVICSVHDAQYHYDMQDLIGNLMGSNANLKKDVLGWLADQNKKVDSTSSEGTRTKLVEAALKEAGNDLGANGIQSWMMQGQAGNADKDPNNNYILYWSTVDIKKVEVGTWVRVIRYDSRTKEYAAGYVQVGQTKMDDQTYHTLGSKPGNDAKVTVNFQPMGDPQKQYTEVVGAFASLDETSATKPEGK